jgi:hypothetical protein
MAAAASCNDGAAMSEPYRDDEDWRVEVELAQDTGADRLHAAASELYVNARRELRRHAVVTHDDNVVFAYATTREDAQAAEAALRELATKEHLQASFTLTHWNQDAETWQSPDAQFPTDAAVVAQEQSEAHAGEQQTEADEAKASGIPEFEVRLSLASHREAVALAQRLADEGIPSQRNWRYLLVGAWTEDDANTLADRLRGELGDEVEIQVEYTKAFIERDAHIPLGPISLVPFGPQ